MSDITVSDTVLSGAVYAYAVRRADLRYWNCFIVGLPHVSWRAVMDDFGDLVRVSQ